MVALVAALALIPVGYLLEQAFVEDGALTLGHFDDAYANQGLGSMAFNSLWFAAGSSLLALVAGTALAFLVVRTDMPFRRVVFALALVPLIVPGILYTVAWIFLASPRSGALRDVLPVDPDVFSMGGMIFVEGLHLAPLVFLLMAAAFRSADPALEEAALMSGAPRVTVVRRVTLPVVRPALYAALLIMVVTALASFEVPALLGVPGDTYVFTSRIFDALLDFPQDIEEAAALSVSLLALTALGVVAYSRLAGSPRRFETITGGGHRARTIELGRWRRPAALLAGGYLLVASVLPLLILAYASTQPFYASPSLDGLGRASLDNYSAVLERPGTLDAVKNSVVLGVGTATALVVVMGIVAWLTVRSRIRGRTVLDVTVSLPLVIPGLVVGVALLVLSLRSPLPIYGTLWLLFLAYFIAADAVRDAICGRRHAPGGRRDGGRRARQRGGPRSDPAPRDAAAGAAGARRRLAVRADHDPARALELAAPLRAPAPRYCRCGCSRSTTTATSDSWRRSA